MNEARFDNLDSRVTQATRRRYERIAPFYDAMQAMMEQRFAPWRERQWALVQGPKVLEVGVGTGNNLSYYRSDLEVTGIDLAARMLNEHTSVLPLKVPVQLCLGDVQSLDFPPDTFDSAVATFVFCSVPNPLLGLSELRRVVKPGGRVILLEHMRSTNRILGAFMDILNPLVVRAIGANISRRTLDNVQRIFPLVHVEDAGRGIVKLMIAYTEQ